MNLFVIGNGFDKAHSLKTDYIDFRDFLYEIYPDFLSSFEEAYGNCLESNRELVNDSLWRTFETNLCNIAEDYIIDVATSISLGLEGGDVDIEDTMMTYWEEQYSYIERLREYLHEWVTCLDINVPTKTNYIQPVFDGEDDVTEDMFLTFNYTLVLEDVYKIDSENICHIHSSIYNGDDELVIGHGNKDKQAQAKVKMYQAQEVYNDKKSSIYSVLANYYERTEKDVKFYMANNSYFFGSLKNVEKIYIIGHSLGEVDLPYFIEIQKNVAPTTQWIVICRNNSEAQEKMTALRYFGVADEMVTSMTAVEFFNK